MHGFDREYDFHYFQRRAHRKLYLQLQDHPYFGMCDDSSVQYAPLTSLALSGPLLHGM